MSALIPKTNATPSSATAPLPAALIEGEVAENKFTGRLYIKQESGDVRDVAAVIATGDATGTTAAPTTASDGGTINLSVVKLLGRTLNTTAPTSGQAYVWNSGSSQWVPTTIPANTDFTGSNQSLTANGYQKLPGGVIIQWGSLSATSIAASSSRTDSVTFPVAFPTACLNASATARIDGVQAAAGIATAAPTTTAMSVERRNLATSTSQSIAAYWVAIGY